MVAGQPYDDAGGGFHELRDPARDIRSAVDRGAADLALAQRRHPPGLRCGGDFPDSGDGADHVSLHRAGLAIRSGDGDAECEKCLRDAGARLVLFQHWINGRWRGDWLLDGPGVGAEESGRIRMGCGDRRHRAAGLPVPGAGERGLSLCGEFQME